MTPVTPDAQPSEDRSPSSAPDVTATATRLRAAGCVFADQEAALLHRAARGSQLEELVRRRIGGQPLETVLGWAEFCGIRVAVTPGVFVPRRRTEMLVDRALARLRPGSVVLDLCCGSGALARAVSERARVPVQVWASDLDPIAVDCARRNLPPDRVRCGDLFDDLPTALRGRVDVLLVNAPYVPSGSLATLPAEARHHEPRPSLDGGPDGLDVHRRVIASAGDWLSPEGVLLAEVAETQLPAAIRCCREARLTARPLRDASRDAVGMIARRSAAPLSAAGI